MYELDFLIKVISNHDVGGLPVRRRYHNESLYDYKLRLFNSVVAQPDFKNSGRVHDWRNHVPKEFKEKWDSLSSETKLAIAHMASLQADKETWE